MTFQSPFILCAVAFSDCATFYAAHACRVIPGRGFQALAENAGPIAAMWELDDPRVDLVLAWADSEGVSLNARVAATLSDMIRDAGGLDACPFSLNDLAPTLSDKAARRRDVDVGGKVATARLQSGLLWEAMAPLRAEARAVAALAATAATGGHLLADEATGSPADAFSAFASPHYPHPETPMVEDGRGERRYIIPGRRIAEAMHAEIIRRRAFLCPEVPHPFARSAP